MAEKAAAFGPETMRSIEKQVLLQIIDAKWREHLLTLEHLRSVVGFRGYAQRDPLNEYKTESFQLFETMLDSLREDVTQKLVPDPSDDRGGAGADDGADPAAAAGAAGGAGQGTARCHGPTADAGDELPAGVAARRVRRDRPEHLGQPRAERPLPLRVGQEVQALPRPARLIASCGARSRL